MNSSDGLGVVISLEGHVPHMGTMTHPPHQLNNYSEFRLCSVLGSKFSEQAYPQDGDKET